MTRPRIAVVDRSGGVAVVDELRLAGLVEVLAGVDASVVVLTPDPDHVVRVHDVPALASYPPDLAIAAMAEAQLVLVAGDRILHEVAGPSDLRPELSQLGLAIASGTGVLPFGVEVGNVSSPAGRRLCHALLERTLPGLVRSRPAAEALTALGASPPSIAPDLTYALPPPWTAAEDRLVVCLGSFNSSPDPSANGAGVDVEGLASALDQTAMHVGLPVAFVALDDASAKLHDRVAARMAAATTPIRPTGVDFLRELGRSRVVITSQRTGLVGAVLGGRPAVVLGDETERSSLADHASEALVDHTVAVPGSLVRLPQAVQDVIGRDADVIDVREQVRARLIRARSVVERTLHAS